MKRPSVECPTCDGTGTVLLDEALFRTLETLRQLKRASAPDLWRAMPDKVGATAFNQRMERLLARGLVIRTKEGKSWVYSTKK